MVKTKTTKINTQNFNISIFLAIILICLIIGLPTYFFTKNKSIYPKKFQIVKSQDVPQGENMFVNIMDDKGNKLNVMLIAKPFMYDKDYDFYVSNKDKIIFLGISSYLEFPNKISNPLDVLDENLEKYKYKEITEGWIHCFRNPEKYFSPDMPLYFASESDWTDCHLNKPDPTIEKKYDFIYICLKVDEKLDKCDDWATYNKNWDLGKECLKVFCQEMKLKGLLVGRKDCPLPDKCSDLMTTTNIVSNDELKKYYNQSRFIFIPNQADASPRVLTEALCCNIPCLVNYNILGGWKYVNQHTGEFFTDASNVKTATQKILDNIKNNQYQPRKYFVENYGIPKSGARLKKFLYQQYGKRLNIPENKVNYFSIRYDKNNYEECKAE